MASLLGQFFPCINGSQEDIASKGLVYVLQSSRTARGSLGQFILRLSGLSFGDLHYQAQNANEYGRPDISGFDEAGHERLIIEAKFWASLTENQPAEYLKRLNTDSVLLFVCPNLRKTSLFPEIERKLNDASVPYTKKNDALYLDGNKQICLTGWYSLLNTIKDALIAANERNLVSDIDQIIGFCQVVDDSALLPMRDIDLSPSTPKKINSYNDILDKVVDKLVSEVQLSLTGYRATGHKYGYTRYASIGNFGIMLEVNLKFWETIADTPFWFSVKSSGNPWIQPNDLQTMLHAVSAKTNTGIHSTAGGILYFSLFPPLNTVEDVVINNLSSQIAKILYELETADGV